MPSAVIPETCPLSTTGQVFPVKVRQREQSDCGVACLAMAAKIGYDLALAAFTDAGLAVRRGRKPGLASNFQELRKALALVGTQTRLRRFKGWDSLGNAAILKVFVTPNGNWHWVFVGRDPLHGLFVQDPGTELAAFEVPPPGLLCLDLTLYFPTGCYIEIC